MMSSSRVEKDGRPLSYVALGTEAEESGKATKTIREECVALTIKADSDPKVLQNVADLAQVVDAFFSRVSAESELEGILKVEPEYAKQVIALKGEIIALRRAFMAIRNGGARDKLDRRPSGSMVGGVVRQMNHVVQACRGITDGCVGEVRQRAQEIARDIESELDGYGCGEAEAQASGEPGGETGSVALGTFFAGHAASERKAANRLRYGVISLSLVIAALAGGILFYSSFGSGTFGRELARLSITVPLAALAVYLGGEASRHRNAADRAAELGAHLKHLDGYIKNLSVKEQQRYRYELGQRAYAVGNSSVGEGNFPDLVKNVAGLVKAIKEFASR